VLVPLQTEYFETSLRGILQRTPIGGEAEPVWVQKMSVLERPPKDEAQEAAEASAATITHVIPHQGTDGAKTNDARLRLVFVWVGAFAWTAVVKSALGE
jgi:hypothetical protein